MIAINRDPERITFPGSFVNISSRYQQMSGDFLRASADVADSNAFVVANPQMAALLATATRVATSEGKVLITGESGVGKDLVARHVHAHSRRAPRPFIAINCAALTDSLLESELFGHVKGSF
ncbi:MAG TPA: sigma 54-interacting transcriptional regulator, partial [Gemmatimonadaceae bacterium]|nr:sigma 54-interacting transcriptional regulator [Gemmatimonadaceae bacterium]